MDAIYIGIDVSKDRLDVHVRCGRPLADRNASRRMAAGTMGQHRNVSPSFETAAHKCVRPPQDEVRRYSGVSRAPYFFTNPDFGQYRRL